MNACFFIGNLTADPELRYTQPKGDAVTSFSVAVNERRGEREETEFLDFQCWDKLAESVAEYGRKGRKVAVEAKYHTDRWEENGTKRSKVRFRARNVEFLDKPPESVKQQAGGARSAERPARSADEDAELDQLPF